MSYSSKKNDKATRSLHYKIDTTFFISKTKANREITERLRPSLFFKSAKIVNMPSSHFSLVLRFNRSQSFGLKLVKKTAVSQFLFSGKIAWKNLFEPSVPFHVETSHLICNANWITGFYMKCNTGLKWVAYSTLLVIQTPQWIQYSSTQSCFAAAIYLLKVNNKMWNMFKVNNKETRTIPASFWCLYF